MSICFQATNESVEILILTPFALKFDSFAMSVCRNRMSLNANQAFYLIVNNKSISSMSSSITEIYRDDKDEDGFLYMTYASQEMFGASL